METTKITIPEDMRSKEQKKKVDQEFKAELKKDEERVKEQKEAVKHGAALDSMRNQINLTVFRRIQSRQEIKSVAEETLVFLNWARHEFGYDREKALKLYREDARKLSEKLYKEALKKV